MRVLQERGPVAALIADRRAVAVTAATAGVALALDQLTKSWALEALADGPIHLFWTFDLRLTFNTGASFSMGTGFTPFLTVLGVVLVGVLVVMARGMRSRAAAFALGLMVGGALGNLTDRLARDHGGAVVDFVDPGWWPVFNVADAALVCGAILLVLVSARSPEP